MTTVSITLDLATPTGRAVLRAALDILDADTSGDRAPPRSRHRAGAVRPLNPGDLPPAAAAEPVLAATLPPLPVPHTPPTGSASPAGHTQGVTSASDAAVRTEEPRAARDQRPWTDEERVTAWCMYHYADWRQRDIAVGLNRPYRQVADLIQAIKSGRVKPPVIDRPITDDREIQSFVLGALYPEGATA